MNLAHEPKAERVRAIRRRHGGKEVVPDARLWIETRSARHRSWDSGPRRGSYGNPRGYFAGE
jgi:hypothetical protein